MDSFDDALKALVGELAGGLNANTIVRLKEPRSAEYEQWCRHNLTGNRYVSAGPTASR